MYRMCRIKRGFPGHVSNLERKDTTSRGDMTELGDHDSRKVDLRIRGKGDMACLGVDFDPLCLDTIMMCH